MEGDYVVRKFDHGEHMFFIHRGCVDVVSEDATMVFATMHPGRFFGEISLLKNCPRTASVRAQTNCDVYILKKDDLDQVFLGYPSIKQQVLDVVEERIVAVRMQNAAKESQTPLAAASPSASVASQLSASSAASVIARPSGASVTPGASPKPKKEQDNNTSANNNTKAKASKKSKEDVQVQMEIDDQSVEINTPDREPFLRRLQKANQVVIDPSSFRLRILYNITFVLVVFTSMLTIFQAAYQYDSAWVLALIYLFELVFMFEIFVKFHVTQADQYGELELNFDKVYKLYLKSFSGFALDIVPTIPFEIFAVFAPVGSRFAVFTYIRFTRLIRLIRVQHYFSQWEQQLDIVVLKVRLTKMLIFVMLIIHFCACIWHFIACPSGECKEKSWVTFQEYEGVAVTGERYTDSIYWCVATITSTGYGDITAHSFEEMLFASFVMILGQLLVGTVLGNIASTLANRDNQRVAYEKELENVKRELDENQVDEELKENVIEYFDYLWLRNKGVSQLDLFKNLPFCMRTELALDIYGKHLRNLRLFKDCSEAFFRDISLCLNEVILRAGDDIVDEGDIGDEMYIIHKGQVNVISERDPTAVECILKEGDYFDDINLLNDTPRSKTIKALTQVDLVTISMEDINKVMERFPEDATKIKEIGQNIFSRDAATASYSCSSSAAASSEAAAQSQC
ncbi:potassium voltage-gated channel unc-103-like isoform X2 [Amphiura filiformis]|uniref:potassium voltage-gated channel unc-103-like isoform X2 n=1 Tax=Amphiura filiformis TaxID=82378 RepID=UPI003B2253D3